LRLFSEAIIAASRHAASAERLPALSAFAIELPTLFLRYYAIFRLILIAIADTSLIRQLSLMLHYWLHAGRQPRFSPPLTHYAEVTPATSCAAAIASPSRFLRDTRYAASRQAFSRFAASRTRRFRQLAERQLRGNTSTSSLHFIGQRQKYQM
jgi:hypothetical protein